MLHSQLAALALAATTLAVSGCGGSSKTEPAKTTASTTSGTAKTESGAPLTRAEFIARGEAICAHANAELNSHPIRSPKESALSLIHI